MFNIAILTGRLTADPELKYTQNNVPVCSFTIAVNRQKRADEEQQTDFINIVAWRQNAEFISKYFQKGSLIGIEGAIQTRNYTDKNGNDRKAVEVVVKNAQFAESKKDKPAEAEPAFSDTSNDDFTEISGDGDLPF